MTIATPWTEEQLLAEFWKAQNDLAVDRLQLLRLYAMVVVARPHGSRKIHRHHVIQIQNGGSNDRHNLTEICDGLYRCGNCAAAIGKGEPFMETRRGAIRCRACAANWGEHPPAVIEEDAATSVPDSWRQASLGLGDAR